MNQTIKTISKDSDLSER